MDILIDVTDVTVFSGLSQLTIVSNETFQSKVNRTNLLKLPKRKIRKYGAHIVDVCTQLENGNFLKYSHVCFLAVIPFMFM